MPVSIEKVPAGTLHVSKPTWWLESRFHFHFANWHTTDTKKESFGALRVINDDLVKPQSGFGTHPHRDAEIFSYIIDGELSHADSMGNREALPRGCVQYLSAGTGISHSEMNDHPSETTRFLQIWFTPDRRGHRPNYGSTKYTKADRSNRLLQILGGTGTPPNWPDASPPSDIRLNQDANIYVSESDAGKQFEVTLGAARQAYMVCIEGSIKVNDVELSMRDGARLVGDASSPSALTLTAGKGGVHFILMEMKAED